MALAKTVEESLKEAEASLRNALSFAARAERPFVVTTIADLISKIDTMINVDSLMDRLDNIKIDNKDDRWDIFSGD